MTNKKTTSSSLLVAIETATPVGSVAILDAGDGGRVIGEWLASPQKGHSRTLLAGLDSLLDATQSSRADISHIAISEGPGSFTGLGVGMAMADGLNRIADALFQQAKALREQNKNSARIAHATETSVECQVAQLGVTAKLEAALTAQSEAAHKAQWDRVPP